MSIVYLLLFIGIPLGASMLAYERMRSRGSSPTAAGCVSIVAGVAISFTIAGILLLFSIT